MKINDIVAQVVAMKGLMPEVNRTCIAYRFKHLITQSMVELFGEDSQNVRAWVPKDGDIFLQNCQLVAPDVKVPHGAFADSSPLAELIDKWESVDHTKTEGSEDWVPMSQETVNVKAAILKELRGLIQ